jgi:hypothetical protein
MDPSEPFQKSNDLSYSALSGRVRRLGAPKADVDRNAADVRFVQPAQQRTFIRSTSTFPTVHQGIVPRGAFSSVVNLDVQVIEENRRYAGYLWASRRPLHHPAPRSN